MNWREFGIMLFASLPMTLATVGMAATEYQRTGNRWWWLLLAIFPAISASMLFAPKGRR